MWPPFRHTSLEAVATAILESGPDQSPHGIDQSVLMCERFGFDQDVDGQLVGAQCSARLLPYSASASGTGTTTANRRDRSLSA